MSGMSQSLTTPTRFIGKLTTPFVGLRVQQRSPALLRAKQPWPFFRSFKRDSDCLAGVPKAYSTCPASQVGELIFPCPGPDTNFCEEVHFFLPCPRCYFPLLRHWSHAINPPPSRAPFSIFPTPRLCPVPPPHTHTPVIQCGTLSQGFCYGLF